jgi:hypothetical protein
MVRFGSGIQWILVVNPVDSGQNFSLRDRKPLDSTLETTGSKMETTGSKIEIPGFQSRSQWIPRKITMLLSWIEWIQDPKSMLPDRNPVDSSFGMATSRTNHNDREVESLDSRDGQPLTGPPWRLVPPAVPSPPASPGPACRRSCSGENGGPSRTHRACTRFPGGPGPGRSGAGCGAHRE